MPKFVKIGERLRIVGEQKYQTMAEFARALEITPIYLSHYLSGRARPGNVMQEKLRSIGCDIEWLMTGKTEVGKKRVCTCEEEAMIERLRGMGITTLEQLEMFLDPKDMAQDLAFVLRERMAKYKIKYKKIK